MEVEEHCHQSGVQIYYGEGLFTILFFAQGKRSDANIQIIGISYRYWRNRGGLYT